MSRPSTFLAAAALAAAAILSLAALRVEEIEGGRRSASCATSLCGLVIF